jgi:hypothetical protein
MKINKKNYGSFLLIEYEMNNNINSDGYEK